MRRARDGRSRAIRGTTAALIVTCGALVHTAAAGAVADFPYPMPQPVSGDTAVHDPSIVVRPSGPRYGVFSTGPGIPVRDSTDRVNYSAAERAFTIKQPWWATYTNPDGTNPNNEDFLWAPDVSYQGNKYLMYYAASSFGSRKSAIGLATSANGRSAADLGAWADQGIVISSTDTSPYNAIDPNLVVVSPTQWYLAYGSWNQGIYMVALDPATGKRPLVSPPAPFKVAERPAPDKSIEAAYVYHRGNYWYLFTSWGTCCKNRDKTTYNVRVGRSTSPTGGYVDRSGAPLLTGGGTLVLEGHDNLISAGHQGVFLDPADNRERLYYHYYLNQMPDYPNYLGINVLNWTTDGWPYLMHDYGPKLPAPHRIFEQDYLSSPSGQYTLKLQADCNLVERNAAGDALWASDTWNLGTNCRLVVQPGGVVGIYDGATGNRIWDANNTAGTGDNNKLRLQDDGNIVVYDASGTALCARFGTAPRC
jgi:arabinan endo-1,5-alpha-L-arabinosidase